MTAVDVLADYLGWFDNKVTCEIIEKTGIILEGKDQHTNCSILWEIT